MTGPSGTGGPRRGARRGRGFVPAARVAVALLVASFLAGLPLMDDGGPSGPQRLAAQENDDILPPAPERPDRMRIGLTLGGTSLVGITAEYRRGQWAGEVTVGTIGLSDISASATGKRYAGSGQFQPMVGLGLWGIVAWGEEGRGHAIIARAPAGGDWNFAGSHALGLELALNRALRVERMDPDDDAPPREAFIPIPSFYYRFGWTP